jgi:dTDP-4-dehydrorhamnose 3,5-epimerase
MEFRPASIRDMAIVEVQPIADHRGHFARVFAQEEFAAAGLERAFVHGNIQFSPRPGTLRGMHLQAPPHEEVKLVRCTRGAVFDVVVDLREGSPTYRQWHGEELRAEAYTTIWVPEGCAHGFVTLEPDSEVQYMTSHVFAPDAATGIRFDDPAIGITWPVTIEVVSDRDATWPLLDGAA